MSSAQKFQEAIKTLDLAAQRWVIVTSGERRVIGLQQHPATSGHGDLVPSGMICLSPVMEYMVQAQIKNNKLDRTAMTAPFDLTDGFCGAYIRPDRILVLSHLDEADRKSYADLIKQGLEQCLRNAAKSGAGLVL